MVSVATNLERFKKCWYGSAKTYYKYRILLPSAGISSRDYEMRVGDFNAENVRFALAGDMQDNNGGQKWSEVAEQIGKNGTFDFIVANLVSFQVVVAVSSSSS